MTSFTADHAQRTGAIQLEAPIEDVFPLFGPVRESEWAAGWTIEPLHAETPLLEETGAVFLTRQHGNQPTIWIVILFDRDQHRVSYARITPGQHAVIVEVACTASGEGTQARVTYTLTGLSAEGNAFIEHDFSETHYPMMLAQWQQAINHRLKTGQTLEHHG